MKKTSKTVLQATLVLLNRKDYSQKELTQKLILKGYTKDEITPVIEDLAAKDIQSDARALKSIIATCFYYNYGPHKILTQAVSKGFLKEEAEVALEKFQQEKKSFSLQNTNKEEIDENSNAFFKTQAFEFIEKRFGFGPYDLKTKTKILRRLISRGYPYDVAISVSNGREI